MFTTIYLNTYRQTGNSYFHLRNLIEIISSLILVINFLGISLTSFCSFCKFIYVFSTKKTQKSKIHSFWHTRYILDIDHWNQKFPILIFITMSEPACMYVCINIEYFSIFDAIYFIIK